MISEKDLTNSQNTPYEERIARIEKMIEKEESPKAFELGLLLALKMGQEIREKKPLGSESGDLVISWKDRYSEYVIEEAIASAKEFLLHPASIAEKIRAGMKKFEQKPEEDADSAAKDNASEATGGENGGENG